MNELNRDGDAARFMTTQWTHVLAARGQSAAARESLQALCERYYAPVAAFVRRYTQDDQQAQDWTHSFFAKLLEGHSLNTVLPSKGKFRSYLLGAVKHFLADERTRQQADKRGGSTAHLPIDAANDIAAPDSRSSIAALDAYFDRQWAISILQISLEDLEAELDAAHLPRFQRLRPWLSGDPSEHSLAEVATQLGLSSEAAKVTIHRWRKRFRTIVKSHIASTVCDESEVEDELGYLIRVLAPNATTQ